MLTDDHSGPFFGDDVLERAAMLILDGSPLTFAEVAAVAHGHRRLGMDARVLTTLTRSRGVVEAALHDGLPHYGINTGFGSLARKRIDEHGLRDLQRNLIRSHAAGIGEPLPGPVVRAMMLLLAASLCRGYSGVRPIVVQTLVDMLNAGITPVVPSVGSVGASGDLAPLAAIGLVLLGEGYCYVGSAAQDQAPTSAVFPRAGIAPLTLEAKEGLAIINGTHLMTARGALLAHGCQATFDAACVAAAMTIDGVRGTDSFLDARIHAARGQPGQVRVAARLRSLLAGSQIIPSHREDDPRVQDPYCLRCTPQVLGAALDTLLSFRTAISHELGAVTDNPLVFADDSVGSSGLEADPGSIVSGGNFHGMPLAIPLDYITIALTHIAGISERRTYWIVSAFDGESKLRPYLATDPGVDSGLMIAQYTAAACCNEMITLCTPASVSNISTSAGIEDYNSFGPRAAAKAARALDLLNHVLAIELLCAAQAIEQQRPLRSGQLVEVAHARVRKLVRPLQGDRTPTPDIEALARAVAAGDFAFGTK
jgi:histidine ammonia-lyase